MTAGTAASLFPVPVATPATPEPPAPTLADLAAVWPDLDEPTRWTIYLRARALAGRAFNEPPPCRGAALNTGK